MLTSGLSAILAVGVLVYFLHHVPSSIRIDTVLGEIGRRLIRDIEQRFPLASDSDEASRQVSGHIVTARHIGYVRIIDFSGLDQIARDQDVQIALRVRTGDFIHPHLPVLEVAGAHVSESVQTELLRCFSLGETRTPTQDLEFLIDELVEIALRALSPGINDPFTAVTSMHWMGAALAQLSDRNLERGPEHASYSERRVQPLRDDFAHFVQRSFGAIRASVAHNVIASTIFIEVLRGVLDGTPIERRKSVLIEEARKLGQLAETSLTGPSLLDLQQRLENISQSVS